jgi:hypothetical protein
MEKQKILSNVRVTAITKFSLDSISLNDKQLAQNKIAELEEELQNNLSSNLINLSMSMGRVPTEVSRLLHKSLLSVKYDRASFITVPAGNEKIYTAQVSGVSLSDGGTYGNYFICVSRHDNMWHVSGSHSLPRFVSKAALDYKPFTTVKSGVNTIKEILSSEGILIKERKFSLTPKETI